MEHGKVLRIDEKVDASGAAGLAADEAGAFQGEDHLVDGRRRDAEVPLHVGFGRGPAEDAAIGMDEGQILALLFGEGGTILNHLPNI
jgi:hypothetical protein